MPAKTTDFATRLRLALAGHNRQAVCDKVGKSLRAMTGWLNGSNQPLASTVADLARVLGVSGDWLLGLSRRRKP